MCILLLIVGDRVFIVAILIIVLVLSAASIYVAKGLYHGLNSFFPKVRFWQVMSGVSVITIFLVIGFLRSSLSFSDDVNYVLGFIGCYCMGIFAYLLLYTIIAEVIFIIPRLKKIKFTAYRYFNGIISIAVVVLTVITCVCGSVNTVKLDVVSYDIKLQSKTDIFDLNMVLISDLHLGAVGSESRLENIVKSINELNPDVICISGDIFDTNFGAIRDPETALETLKKLKSTYGVYACFGNHDGGNTHGKMVSFLEKAGINLLRENYAVIDNRMVIVGRLDGSPIGGYNSNERKDFSKIEIEEYLDLPIVVLDHNPKNIGEYTNTEADLILCGHTHKGQLFPANFVTDVIYDVDYGYYRKDDNSPQVIVTSGVGYWGMPIRVGTDCEIVNIHFEK